LAADFGTAVSWVSDMNAEGRLVSGFRVVAEAVARRWMTPRGRLIGYPNYGFDLTAYVNADMNARDIASLRAGAAAEAEKDERIVSADVSAVLDSSGLLTVTGLLNTGQGPFTMVVEVSAVTVKLLQVSP
jgi:hypothetical protein